MKEKTSNIIFGIIIICTICCFVVSRCLYIQNKSIDTLEITDACEESIDSVKMGCPMTEEERRVYTDYLSDNKGNALFFYLGEYSDMKMSEFAKKEFERVGGIRLLISPNRGLTGYTIVSIGQREETADAIVSDELFATAHYGPIIYHKGAHWIKPWTNPKDKKYTDYQPFCEIHDVKLENSADAQRDVQRLLSFLRKTGRLHWDEKTRQALKSNGKPLTEIEYKIAKRFGLIISKKEWFFFEQDCGVHPNYKYMK